MRSTLLVIFSLFLMNSSLASEPYVPENFVKMVRDLIGDKPIIYEAEHLKVLFPKSLHGDKPLYKNVYEEIDSTYGKVVKPNVSEFSTFLIGVSVYGIEEHLGLKVTTVYAFVNNALAFTVDYKDTQTKHTKQIITWLKINNCASYNDLYFIAETEKEMFLC